MDIAEDNDNKMAHSDAADSTPTTSVSNHQQYSNANAQSSQSDNSFNTSKLHIGGIDKSTDERALKNEFMKFGEIAEVKIIRRSNKGQPLEN